MSNLSITRAYDTQNGKESITGGGQPAAGATLPLMITAGGATEPAVVAHSDDRGQSNQSMAGS